MAKSRGFECASDVNTTGRFDGEMARKNSKNPRIGEWTNDALGYTMIDLHPESTGEPKVQAFRVPLASALRLRTI